MTTHLIAFSACCIAAAAGTANAQYVNSMLVTNSLSSGGAYGDPNLRNPRGLAFSPSGSASIANTGSGTATQYNGMGLAQPQGLPLIIGYNTISGVPGGTPRGSVFNTGTGFNISAPGGASSPSRMISSTSDGRIMGWNPDVGSSGAGVTSTSTYTAVDNSGTSASYTGLATSSNDGGVLYAPDFFNGRVDTFDSEFQPLSNRGTAFTDPTMPFGFSPYNTQVINGGVYVSYAQRDAAGQNAVPGAGAGYVSVYDTDGNLLRRLNGSGVLNAPWGMTMAPANFGEFSNALLVGNTGDGTIQAFNPITGDHMGVLRNPDRTPFVVPNLRALTFGNDADTQPGNSLFYTAGNDRSGTFGRIDLPTPGAGALVFAAALMVARRRRVVSVK